jgi:DNA-binding NarL/FixJ family response regulator
MDFIGIIYTWVNTLNGKAYVGLTRSSSVEKIRTSINTPEKLLFNRWKGHVSEAIYRPKDYFHYAIRKYGHEKFNGRVLQVFKASNIDDLKKMLDSAEIRMIEEHNTLAPNGYNLQKGGFSPSFHDETCKKMRAKKQAFLNSDEGREWIQKCSDTQLLHFQTDKGLEQAKNHGEYISELYKKQPEIKDAIRNTLLNYFNTADGKQQIERQKEFMEEFYKTERGIAMKQKLSLHAKQRWQQVGYRENQSKLGKERFLSEDGERRKQNLRDKLAERLKDPEKIAQISEKTKAHFDKVGRKEYRCVSCDIHCRDKTAYNKHCSTKKHTQIASGLTKEEAKEKVAKETAEKISKANKLWAEQNPHKGVTHSEESKEKNRLAHLGKTLTESARAKLSETIKSQYKKGERKNAHAKLTNEQVLLIRHNTESKTQKELASLFNVSPQTISAIQNNLVYKHVVA